MLMKPPVAMYGVSILGQIGVAMSFFDSFHARGSCLRSNMG